MKKMRERRLGDDVILEVLRINKAYPDMKAADIADLVKGKGLAECVSASWVGDVILCGSLEGYRRKLEERRNRTTGKAPEDEPIEGQTEIELPIDGEDKPRMSEAARTMIENQRTIIDELWHLNRKAGIIVCFFSAIVSDEQRTDAIKKAYMAGFVDNNIPEELFK